MTGRLNGEGPASSLPPAVTKFQSARPRGARPHPGRPRSSRHRECVGRNSNPPHQSIS